VAGKFGSSAGEVIAEALVRARAEGTSRIGEEHLFAALLASLDSGPLLGRLGDPEQAEAVRAEVREARGTKRGPAAEGRPGRPADGSPAPAARAAGPARRPLDVAGRGPEVSCLIRPGPKATR
jgi:hypothetical protein